MMTRLLCLAAFALIAAPLRGQTREVEPNDAPATATKVELGGTAAGVITQTDATTHNPDWWSFDAAAGDTLWFEFDGAFDDLWIRLYAPDGTTLLSEPQSRSELRYVIMTPGKYYLWVSTAAPDGGNYYEVGLWTTRHPKPPCNVANDREPNDSDAAAHDVAFGERVDGILCPSGDRDDYRFHATRRMRVQIRIDRDTGSKPASWGNPVLQVGSDRVDLHFKSDWQNGSVLEFWVPETGDYFAAVTTRGGVNIRYSLIAVAAGSVPDGPGDPAVTRAEGLGSAVAFAVAPNGDLYSSDWDRRIWKVTPAGQKSLFVSDVKRSPISLAFDAAGNLLVLSWGGLSKVSPSGQITTVMNGGDFESIAVAADGTMWISTLFDHIKQFDRNGQLLHDYNVVNVNPSNPYGLGHVAFAPDGTLYFNAGDGIYRLVSGAPELFVRDTAEVDQTTQQLPMAGFTFDAAGNLYVTHPFSGGISLYDRTGAHVGKPYAWIPAAPRAIAFGRNADGSTNRRLFVLGNTNYNRIPAPENGTIFELHSSDVDPPPPPPPPQITVDAAVAELLHPGTLSADQLAVLDQRGNQNGRYDVGDLRALLIANGLLAGSRRINVP